MNKYLYLVMAIAMFAFTSCAVSYRQIATISSPQSKIADDGTFSFKEGDVTLSYDFWAESGRVAFLLTNNSDQDIYVDLTRSFLVFNGLTYDYFNNRTYGTSISSASSVVASRGYSSKYSYGSGYGSGSASGSVISGNGYAFGNAYGNSSAYASSTTNYSSSSVTSASSTSASKYIEYKEKEGVWVPAHSSRVFDEFSIMSSVYRECGLARDPSNKEEASVDFTMSTSPVTFENRLMLVFGEQEMPISNVFYISNIMNVTEEKAIVSEDEVDCNNHKTGAILKYNIFRQANKFYLKYERNPQQGAGSNDRINKSGRLSLGKSGAKSGKTFSDGLYR